MEKQRQTLNDGLYLPEVGSWSKRKYALIQHYAQTFATGMKKKWDYRIYVDLFAGAGKAKIKRSNQIVNASPLLALNVKDRFDLYIFCELEIQKINALRDRVTINYPDADVKFISGDVNQKIDEVIASIPNPSKNFKMLSFCVVDPYNLASLKFYTIQRLSVFFMDFLVLIPTGMDAQRNEKIYLAKDNDVVECFLNDDCWREDWERCKVQCVSFSDFLVDAFSTKMAEIGYLKPNLTDTVPVSLPRKNVHLYRLAFYSRDKRGMDFWNKAQKSSDPQLKLW